MFHQYPLSVIYIHLESLIIIIYYFFSDFNNTFHIKVFFEYDGKSKTGPFHNFQLRKSSYELEIDEEVHGIFELPNSSLISEDEVKVGLHCFALWAPENKYYKAVITDIQNKRKRKGTFKYCSDNQGKLCNILNLSQAF